MKKTLRAICILCVLLLAVSMLAGCGGGKPGGGAAESTEKPKEEPKQPKQALNISISTGSTSGTYYPLGTAIAGVINEAGIGVNATAESTGGSVENARLMAQGQTEIIFIESGIADWAYNGKEMFSGSRVDNIRGLISLYPNTMQVVTKAKSNILSYTDLKGKRVSVGIQGGSSPLNMAIVLEAYGLTMNDIKPEYLSFGQAMDLLKDDQKEKYPFFSDPVIIPAGTYKGINEDVPSTGSKVILAVKADMPEEMVYNILSVIFDKKTDIVKVHKAGESINLEKALDSISIPLHPGAEKYYKEKGVLK